MQSSPTAGAGHSRPIATFIVLALTALATGAQLVFPALLLALRRDPAALAAGEWWRLITPLFVHADGWPQIITNLLGVAVVGAAAEQRYGHWGGLLLYFGAGLPAELISYTWEPYGAGASVALCGLVGGLLVWLIAQKPGAPALADLFGLCLLVALAGAALGGVWGSLVGAVLAGSLLGALARRGALPGLGRALGAGGMLAALLLAALHNNHGPPVLVGAGIAALLLWRRAALRD